jgi:acetolactate synthase regulatory subunit
LIFFLSGQVTFFQFRYKCQIIHSKQNEEQMKKVLFVLAIAAFAACNNAAETATEATEAAVDSTVATVEAVADSAKASIDSTAAAAVDSAKAAVDSLKK